MSERHTDCEACGHTDHYAGVYASGHIPYSGRLCYPCGAVGAEAKWIKEDIEFMSGKESGIVTYEDGSYFRRGKPFATRDEVIEKIMGGGEERCGRTTTSSSHGSCASW